MERDYEYSSKRFFCDLTKPKDIVYCIFIGDRSIADVNAEKYNFESKFNNYPNQIEFVDSSTVFKI